MVVESPADKHKVYVLNAPDTAVSDNGKELFLVLSTDHLLEQLAKLTTNTSADGTYKVCMERMFDELSARRPVLCGERGCMTLGRGCVLLCGAHV